MAISNVDQLFKRPKRWRWHKCILLGAVSLAIWVAVAYRAGIVLAGG